MPRIARHFRVSLHACGIYALMANAHGPATRSKAIALFATSQMVGVAVGGSLSGYVAEHLHWRASFWMLGTGWLFAIPLYRFFATLPSDHRPAAQPCANLRR